MAVQGDSVKQERQKMVEAQRLQMHWLHNTLSHQLHLTKKLEHMDKFMAAEEEGNDNAEKENARRQKEQAERKRMQEEQKMAEMMAQQKLEQQIAKEEFERQLQEMEKQKKLQAKARKDKFLKSKADQEVRFINTLSV